MSDKTLPDSPRVSPGEPVLLRVRTLLPSLLPGEAKVAKVVLDQPDLVIYRSVSEVAELAQTSTATVVRCAQSMGYKGFQAMKVALAGDLAGATRLSRATDSPGGILAEVTAAGAQCVRDAGALVSVTTFERVAEFVAGARRVMLVGVGTSAPLCQDAAYRLSALGVLAEHRADAHVQAVLARLLTEEDVCLAVSHTGATRETLEGVKGAREAGARVVALTSFARSPITELSDEVLVAGTRELGPAALEAMASRLAHLAVLDALIVAVAGHDPERTAAALQTYSDVMAEHRL